MNVLLFQENFRQDLHPDASDDWVPTWDCVGSFPDNETAREQAKQLTDNPELVRQPVSNRFAIYEAEGDADKDGIVDGFKFSELVTGKQPEIPKATLRKMKRKA